MSNLGLVRLSLGTAAALGLSKIWIGVKPSTAYLLTYVNGKCRASCGFCTQAKTSTADADLLSRVTWPPYPLQEVLDKLSNSSIRRICIQAVNVEGIVEQVLSLIRSIKLRVDTPISLSIHPLYDHQLKALKDVGVERVTIPLDAANQNVFQRVKGDFYSWDEHWSGLKRALNVFGKGRVGTHLIVGLGESELDMANTIQKLYDLGVYPGLFAFTPVKGTRMERYPRPSIESYRRVQLLHYLITRGLSRVELMEFNGNYVVKSFGISKERLKRIVKSGTPFLTSGCPNCNRPYYNEPPSGPFYNYPRPLKPDEVIRICEQLFHE